MYVHVIVYLHCVNGDVFKSTLSQSPHVHVLCYMNNLCTPAVAIQTI